MQHRRQHNRLAGFYKGHPPINYPIGHLSVVLVEPARRGKLLSRQMPDKGYRTPLYRTSKLLVDTGEARLVSAQGREGLPNWSGMVVIGRTNRSED